MAVENFLLPVISSQFDISQISLPPACPEDETCVYNTFSEFESIEVEPVGQWYEALISRKHAKQTLSAGSLESCSSSEDEELICEEESREEIRYLQGLDPKHWKSQDHYSVLGLKNKRYLASDHDIKRAYRKKVLRHHPDKRRNAGEIVHDLERDYFSCITKAYEILGNPTKRRSYDSVDPEFNDDIPSANTHSKENFFEIYGPVIERNSRWSIRKPVPKLGDYNSTFDEVDRFYKFWYDFDSWREYSYLDEEEKEKGENREERKWIEKQNRVVRQKLKKEEMARIRQLVDNAYSCDPRIQKFKADEKERKLAQKKAKQDAARARVEEEEKQRQAALEAEKKAKEKEEDENRLIREKEKREKEALKKQTKKERKTLEQLCENNGYFADNEDEKINHLQEVDKLCKLLTLTRLQALNEVLQSGDLNARKEAFVAEVEQMNDQLQKEKELASSTQKSNHNGPAHAGQKAWCHDDLQLLVKAVNLFPAGTASRWEVVATFIMQHTNSGIERTAKEVLAKAKDLQKSDGNLKERANKKAYENLEKSQKGATVVVIKDESAPSERFDSPAEQLGVNLAPWTADEQKLLEQALKSYPASTPERWEVIAKCVPGRSKKDCMRRYKELAEMVRAKKAAQAAVNVKVKK